MKTKFLIIAALLVSSFAFAQNAKSILDNASAMFNKGGGVNLHFTLKQEEVKAKRVYTQDGTALIKGNKFKIEVPDGVTWFDVKTQWVYSKGSEEVNISNPSGEELQAISPMVLLNLYKNGFALTNKGETKDRGQTVYKIEMTPQKKGSEVRKMTVNVNKQNSQITSIVIENKNSNKTTLQVKKYQPNAGLAEATFVFNKKDYPKAEVIDLR